MSAPPASTVLNQGTNPAVRPTTPVFESRTPLYPAIAVYIVYREWVNRNPGMTTLDVDDPHYQRYVEKRLRELYPNRGYAGMMREAVAEDRRNRVVWLQHEREVREYTLLVGALSLLGDISAASSCGGGYVDPHVGQDPSWSGQEEFAVPPDHELPTIQMEIDSLQLTGTQIDDIYYYESIANGTYSGGGGGGGGTNPIHMYGAGMTTDELIRAAAMGYTPSSGEIGAQSLTAGVLVVGLGLMGWKAYRAATAHNMARQKSSALYPNLELGDTKRDAHRHIYWSMMLRRWVGAGISKSVTDWYENYTNSEGPARVMDLHNNDIGRTHRYNSFRGHWLWARWDTDEWAIRIRDYVSNESVNGEFIAEWERPEAPITTLQAWAREACVSDDKYIFFSRETI